MSTVRTEPRADYRTHLGETIVAELRASRLPVDPRQFEFWFAHKSGHNPALSAAADAICARNGALTGPDIDLLHHTHLSPWRMGERPEVIAVRLAGKLQELSQSIEAAVGSADMRRESLAAETAQLGIDGVLTLQAVLTVIDRLTQSTKASQIRYALLEARLDATAREVGELKRHLSAVRTECRADATTALPNRAAFDEHLAKAIDEAAATRQPVSVILCDLDYFATFNENFGTPVGDQVLRTIGVLFQSYMRPGDTLARFGGDVYAAIMPQMRGTEAVAQAERFRCALAAHELLPHPNGAGRVTVSIGVADAIKGDTSAFLLRRASNGVDVAKREGGNRTVEMTLDGPVWDADRRT